MNLEKGINKEWILTNGIGGYCYSTILGCNTRKYHGLLVAPLTPPARRHVILSKVDEALEIDGKEHVLYTNVCKNFVSEGYKNLVNFKKDIVPIFTYQVRDTQIKKAICMEYGKNTVCVYYRIKNGNYNSKFKVAPIVNFRDFHTMSTNHDYNLNQIINNRKVKLIIDNNGHYPVYMYMSQGKYTEHVNDKFKNMYYIEEEKRGFYPEEDLAVTGVYELNLLPNEEKDIYFICSLEDNIEEIDVKRILEIERDRILGLMKTSNLIKSNTLENEKDLIKKYIVAADNFVVNRPNFRLHTIIAGYPWFLDWGRDSMIAFEGLLLVTKRLGIAREVLLTFVRDIKYGLVPNGYSGYDNRPLYNSVDASLLLFEQIEKYIRYTEDYKFIEENIYQKNLL